MRRLRIILQSKYLFKILAFFFLLFSILYTEYISFESKYNEDDTVFVGIVKSYKINDNKLIINLLGKEEIIVHYRYDALVFDTLNIGDKLKVVGSISKPKSSTNFNSFDYQKYLYYKRIYYIVNASSIDKLDNNRNVINTIKNIINDRIKNYKSKDYIITLILGNNNIDNEVKNSYRILGISHLFSASGMHINLIISILYSYLNKVSYSKKIKYVISDIFLILYLMLSFTSSLLRSVITYLLFTINDIFNFNIKKIDILFLTLCLCLIINPFIIHDIGFIYSYIISFFLTIFYIKMNNKILGICYIALISFLVSMPINIYTSYEINFLSILINILLTPILSIILLPLSLLTIFIPILDDLLYLIINFLEKISSILCDIDFFKLILSKPSIIFVFIYYLIIIFILKKKKYFYFVIILIFIHMFIPYFNSDFKVTIFDAGQGDSFLISYPYNRKNIMIDVGNENDYRINNEMIVYFKSMGIRKIDYLIITHGDEDHIGGAIDLVNNFKVEKVIFNCGPYNDLEKDLIKVLDKKKVKYYSCIKTLNIDNNKLYFLQTKEYNNENDNSNVIYTKLNGYKFMFMGDASATTEKEILDKYNLSDIDVLKVGHHGSKTSSSKEFIDEINPKYSIISVGKNNRYGHPNKEVLENLKNSKIYRTDQDCSIMFKIKNNNLKIETCSP